MLLVSSAPLACTMPLFKVPPFAVGIVRRTIDGVRTKTGAVVHAVRNFGDGSCATSLNSSIVAVERAAGKRAAQRSLREAKQALAKGLKPQALTYLPSQIPPEARLENHPFLRKRKECVVAPRVTEWLRQRQLRAKALFGCTAPFYDATASGHRPCRLPVIHMSVPCSSLHRFTDRKALVAALLQRSMLPPASSARPVVARHMSTERPACMQVSGGEAAVPHRARASSTPVAFHAAPGTFRRAARSYRALPVTSASFAAWGTTPRHAVVSATPVRSVSTAPSSAPSTGAVPPVVTTTSATMGAGRARTTAAAPKEGACSADVAVVTVTPAQATRVAPVISKVGAIRAASSLSHGGCAPTGRTLARTYTLRGNTEGSAPTATSTRLHSSFRAVRAPLEGAAPARVGRRGRAASLSRAPPAHRPSVSTSGCSPVGRGRSSVAIATEC